LDEVSARGFDHAELSDELADAGSTDELERRARFRDAIGAIAALPDRQRAAVIRTADGESPAEIALGLGISETAARQLLHRARVRLRSAVHGIAPPPLVWLGSRAAGRLARFSPSGAVAPLVPKVAAVVVATTATVAIAPIQIPFLPGLSHRSTSHAHRTPQAALGQRAGFGAWGPAGGTEGAALASFTDGPFGAGDRAGVSDGRKHGQSTLSRGPVIGGTATGISGMSQASSAPGTTAGAQAATGSDPAASDTAGVDPPATTTDTTPAPTDTAPTDTAPTDTTPTDTTPTDIAPAPTDTAPASTDTTPAPTDTAPASTDTTPTDITPPSPIGP
jgi:DNA-binding CsgD family transcriptional regulator